MRLLFVHAAMGWSGPARVLATVAHALASRGHETAVASPDGSAMARLVTRSAARPFALGAERRARADAARLREIIEEHHSDTVFVHAEGEHLMAAQALRKVGRGALVRRIGAGGTLEVTPRTLRAERWWPTRYLYTSEAPPAAATRSGLPAAVRVELGVEVPEEAAPPVRDPYAVVACIAASEAIRRATQVVRAVAMLAQRHSQLRLRVIGSAAADPDLHVLATALGLAGRVEWYPQGSRAVDVLDGVSAGWVVADGDDAALGVLHLMAHGIVPLAERTPVTARYLTDGIHGVLLSSLHPPTMAAETTVLLADAPRRATMGGAGRARVEREFQLREMLAGFEGAARASRDAARART
ncbi:MAG: glycosyltransferase [Gemmatimonadetes bacterium]|nr:glycosyltransferase [Gemmatimonadota bacterium]